MTLHHPPTLVVSNCQFHGLDDWQSALDRQDFLVPLRLQKLSLGSFERSAGTLGQKRLEFTCERQDVGKIVRTLDSLDRWEFAFAFRGLGTMETSAAANMLALAYAVAANGAFFRVGHGASTAFAETKINLDLVISVVLGRTDLFAARYPELARQEPAVPGIVESKLAD